MDLGLLRRRQRDPGPRGVLRGLVAAGATGLPILAGAIAAMECEVLDRFAVGDHFLYVGRVEAIALDEPDAPPLLYHRRRYLRIERATTTTVAGKPESPAG